MMNIHNMNDMDLTDGMPEDETDAVGDAFERELDDRYYNLQKRQTEAAERQAAALERIAVVLEAMTFDLTKDAGKDYNKGRAVRTVDPYKEY